MHDTSAVALSYFQQAATYYQQARYVEAIQHYLSGLKYDKSRYHIYADLAKAYEMVGKWEQALVYLDRALKLCPDSPTVLRRQARIKEEKTYYQTLISQIDLVDNATRQFDPTINTENSVRPQHIVEYKFFKLTVEPAVTPKTLWYICQLIERAHDEVGLHLDCYPNNQVCISIINTYDAPTQTNLPKWASGRYDGNILLKYCADEEPELGVLYSLIRHEWTHLLVELLTHGKCPIWFNEGLAHTIARPLLSYEKLSLQQADENGTLPTISELNQPFTTFGVSERKIAYLQSSAIVASLIDEGGFSSIRQFLSLIGNGIPMEKALWKVYNKSILSN
ncbi:tetratricopeptide repeat protein [Candidatus Poribacteria bacterium]|nr:tetratricopeptide repeat protein [Candidatus Poribacteria bacterium]